MTRAAHPTALAPLRLHVLGSFRLERANQPVRLPTHKIESLLAYLALQPKATGHSREKLAALLWGDSSDTLARSSLRRAFVLLRRALGDGLLLADRERVQVNPAYPLWVDAVEFQAQAERLEKNARGSPFKLDIELYRDDLLVDFYDEWIPPLREHLRSLYVEALLTLAEQTRAAGEYDRTVQLSRLVLQRDPANETAHRHLMFCYWKMGKRSAALSQFQECERILEQELGVQPAAETTELYRRIREQVQASPETPASRFARLPIPPTALVGRGRELAEIKALLPATRLLTLTGAGGSGKTRLAIEAAAELQSDFPGGVGWVDLAKLIDPTLVPYTVAQALGIYDAADRPLSESIANYLHDRHFLLVLDNCEHLVEACAELVEMLLRTCARIKVLATSRQVLNAAGETAWIVPSLAMPSTRQPMPAQIEPYEAIQLFVERARSAQPGFKLTAENWQTVGRICRLLDGIPLAIELAASRIKVLTVGEIESHLDRRFQLLVGGNRTALPRHRTLRATMDWSYELLTEPEKTLFRRLAVFTGGFTLESAARVCGREPLDPRDVLTLLSDLADKSMLLVHAREGASRYRPLETIRQYALERLLESNESERLYAQHLDYMLELATRSQSKLVGAEQKVWLQDLDAEQDNFRAALLRALENPAWRDKGVRLAGLLWRYWWYRAELSEGRSWLQRMLAAHPAQPDEGDLKDHVTATARLGCLTWLEHDPLAARTLLESSVQISQKLEDKENWAWSLAWLSMLANDVGDYELARTQADSSIRLFRQVDDPWGLAYAFFVRGRASLSLGNLDQARSFYETSVNAFRELGDRWGLALPLGHLGVIAYRRSDYATAQRLLGERLSIGRDFQAKIPIVFALSYLARVCMRTHEQEQAKQFLVDGLQLAMEIGNQGMIPELLDGAAELAGSVGETKRAVRLFAAAESQHQALSAPRDPEEQRENEVYLKDVQARMNEKDFTEAWAAGQAMSLEETIRYALDLA